MYKMCYQSRLFNTYFYGVVYFFHPQHLFARLSIIYKYLFQFSKNWSSDWYQSYFTHCWTFLIKELHFSKFMMTSSNGNIFRVTALCAVDFTGTGEFPSQRSVTRGFGVFCHMRFNKRLSKHSKHRWIETPSRPLNRHCNVKGKQKEQLQGICFE